MRVIHLACVAPPQTGGIGQTAFWETTSLIERGIEASLIAPAVPDVASAVPVRRLPLSWSLGNAAALRPRPLERALQDADIVHLHYPFYGTAGRVAALRRRNKIKRLVLTLHMDAESRGPKGVAFELHRLFFQKKILESADALIVSSRDYAEHASFRSTLATRPDSVHELPFGVDEKVFAPGHVDRAAFDVPSEAKVVVFVGGMDAAHDFKGVDVLLHALREVPQAFTVFVGDGELRLGFEKLAAELGVASRVKFFGRVSSEQLPLIYRLGDVFAFPSTSGAEAFGMVALEAQACGVPVVGSSLPGVRTVVENGVTGILVPPRDTNTLSQALREMLANDAKREAMGEAARQRVLLRFTQKGHMDGLMSIYEKLCASLS